MRLDLHIHSTASDGACAPAEVVRMGVEGGLDVIALADHDTVAGLPAAQEAVAREKLPVHVVPALEVSSTTDEGREIHVLGYFVDPAARSIREHQERAEARRIARMETMVDRLGEQGVHVDMDDVYRVAGPSRHMIGRPHLASVLVEAGYAGSVSEAFDRWIGDGHPAFVPTALGSPTAAVHTVVQSGGVAVWAHPPEDLLDDLLPSLVEAGLQGLEVYRPFCSPRKTRRLERTAEEAGLLVSGGSDWHSPERNRPLGDFFVSSDEVEELLAVGGM